MARNPRNQPYSRYQPTAKSCGGKVCHPFKHQAEQAANEMMIINPALALSVYKCMDCHGWHLTKVRVDIF